MTDVLNIVKFNIPCTGKVKQGRKILITTVSPTVTQHRISLKHLSSVSLFNNVINRKWFITLSTAQILLRTRLSLLHLMCITNAARLC